MKILLFILIFSFSIFGQVKTNAGKRLAEVEDLIASVRSEQKAAETNLAELLVKYDNSHPKVKALQAQLEKFNEVLLPLELERKRLLKQKLVANLPNNNIELLKMIVIQNERIIELLERLTPK